MQNKQQMLASPIARATYAKFQRQRIAATVCRGTTSDEFNFFYSGFSYWSNRCLGWVPDFADKPKICIHCLVATPPTQEFEVKDNIDDRRKELRNIDRLSGQANESNKLGRSGLSEIHTVSKHSSKSNKGDATPKNKQKVKSKAKTIKKNTKK